MKEFVQMIVYQKLTKKVSLVTHAKQIVKNVTKMGVKIVPETYSSIEMNALINVLKDLTKAYRKDNKHV